jgi:hypothetical protein
MFSKSSAVVRCGGAFRRWGLVSNSSVIDHWVCLKGDYGIIFLADEVTSLLYHIFPSKCAVSSETQ